MQAVLVPSEKPEKGQETRVSVPCQGLERGAVECAPGFVCSGKNKKVTGGKKVKSTTSTVCLGTKGVARSAGVVIVGVAGGCGRARTVELVGFNAREIMEEKAK